MAHAASVSLAIGSRNACDEMFGIFGKASSRKSNMLNFSIAIMKHGVQ